MAFSLSVPAVAVTWILYVPVGVFGPPPQPVIPMDASVANRIMLLNVNRSLRIFRFLPPRSGSSRKATNSPASSSGPWNGEWAGFEVWVPDPRAAELVLTSVAMVSVDVAVPVLPGVTLDGENVQVVSLGRSLHARLVATLKPFTPVTLTVTIALFPELSVPVAGSRVRVNAGGPGYTVTATAEDVDDALSVSPA